MKKFFYLSCLCSLFYSNVYCKEYIPETVPFVEEENLPELEKATILSNYVNIYLKVGTDFNRSFKEVRYENNNLNKKKADNFPWEFTM